MKKFELLLGTLLISSLTGVSFASPLDLIYDAPGSFWGRIDASPNSATNVSHTEFNATQGIRFQHMKWLTAYVSANWYQQTGVDRGNFWAYGVKNTTLVPHMTIGVEKQAYVLDGNTQIPETNLLVGYVSADIDWNLKKGKGKDDE